MYYKENNNSGLQAYYAKYSLAELLGDLDDKQTGLVAKYVDFITRDKERKSSVSTQGGYTLHSVNCDMANGDITYTLKSIKTGEEKVIEINDLRDYLGIRGELIKSFTNEALIEIKYCCYINSSGLFDEYIDTEYPIIRVIFKEMVLNSDFEVYCKEFYESNLVLPLHLKNYFNDSLKMRYRQYIYEISLCKVLGKSKLTSEEIKNYSYDKAVYLNEIRELIMAEEEHIKRIEYAERAVRFTELYMGLTRCGKVDLYNYVKASKQEVYCVHAPNGDRIATKSEIKLLVPEIYKEDKYFIPKEKRELLLYFVWACTGEYKLINKFSLMSNTVSVVSEEAWVYLDEAITYLRSSEFLQKDIQDLLKGREAIKYPSSAPDELNGSQDMQDKLQKVYDFYKDRTSDSYCKLVCDIAKKGLKYKVILSNKQLSIIGKAYDQMLNPDDKYNRFTPELKGKINEMLNWYSIGESQFTINVMKGVLNSKYCSLKQYRLIIQWYEEYMNEKQKLLKPLDSEDSENTEEIKPKAVLSEDEIFLSGPKQVEYTQSKEVDSIFLDKGIELSSLPDLEKGYVW